MNECFNFFDHNSVAPAKQGKVAEFYVIYYNTLTGCEIN